MLQAKTESGELIILAILSKKEIELLRKCTTFYCPVCKSKVIVKAGPKNIPHFAHDVQAKCPAAKGGEGSYHIEGKLKLYEWLKECRYDVFLEAYIRSINQRPDILLKINQKIIAIEYQCARIPMALILERNLGYKKAGLTPIWIVGANLFKKKGSTYLKIPSFLQTFIHRFSPNFPSTLYFFCPYTKQFIIAQNLHFTSQIYALAKFTFIKMNQLHLADLFSQKRFSKTHLFQLWKGEKRSFRLKPRHQLHGQELNWLHWLYSKQTHVEHLPSIVYLPVASAYLMKTSIWNWQSKICLNILKPLPLGRVFTLRQCEVMLRDHFREIESFPLIKHFQHPIKEYLDLLNQLQLIEVITPGKYRKIKNVYFYKNIEDAIKGDERLMDYFIRLS